MGKRPARYIAACHFRLPDLPIKRDEFAATERIDTKILRKYTCCELLVINECD